MTALPKSKPSREPSTGSLNSVFHFWRLQRNCDRRRLETFLQKKLTFLITLWAITITIFRVLRRPSCKTRKHPLPGPPGGDRRTEIGMLCRGAWRRPVWLRKSRTGQMNQLETRSLMSQSYGSLKWRLPTNLVEHATLSGKSLCWKKKSVIVAF